MALPENCSVSLVDINVFRSITIDNVKHGRSILTILDRLGDKVQTQYIVPEDAGSINPRIEATLKYLEHVIKEYGDHSFLPQQGKFFSFLFQADDQPSDGVSISWQTKKGYRNITLVPDLYYVGYRGYSKFLANSIRAWDERKTKFFWRGTTTGAFDITPETIPFLPRYILCRFSDTLGDLADFGFYNVSQAKPGESKENVIALLRSQGLFKDRVDMEEFSRFKFLIQIDGNGNSWDLVKKLRLGCCLLLVESPWVLWHYDRMTPWEHFVPVKNDMSDMLEVVDWCLVNDKRCAEIAANARSLGLSIDYDEEMRKTAAVIYQHAQVIL